MTVPEPDPAPVGVAPFLVAAGWGGAKIEPLPGDASFRR